MTLREVIEQIEEEAELCCDTEYGRGLSKALYLMKNVEDYSKQCVACGKWFVPTNPFGQRYCSDVCKRNYKRKQK